MADSPRIEELRRRLLKDPASIAFAQLAEEHRRAGDLEEAIRVSEAGLEQHPGYLSARVTLGRALLELGRLEEAGEQFAQVVEVAPDNLIAVRALADIHQRTRKAVHLHRSEDTGTTAVASPEVETDPGLDAMHAVNEPAAVEEASVVGSAVEEGSVGSETVVGSDDGIATADPLAAFAAVASSSEPPDSAGAEAPPADVAPSDPYAAELDAWLAVLDDRRRT